MFFHKPMILHGNTPAMITLGQIGIGTSSPAVWEMQIPLSRKRRNQSPRILLKKSQVKSVALKSGTLLGLHVKS